MNIVFHCLTAAGIGHVAASGFREPGSNAPRLSDFPVIAGAAVVAFLSHGVLDGLKHGYPFSPLLDIVLGASIATGWCLAVRWRFVLLFAAVFFASVLPDLIDLAPVMLKSKLGIDLHLEAGGRLFPWHWPDGSGSMFPKLKRRAGSLQNPGRRPEPRDIRDKSRNRSSHRGSLHLAEPIHFPPHTLIRRGRGSLSAAAACNCKPQASKSPGVTKSQTAAR